MRSPGEFCQSAGMDLSADAIATVRKAYQQANHHLLGDEAAAFATLPSPGFVPFGGRGGSS